MPSKMLIALGAAALLLAANAAAQAPDTSRTPAVRAAQSSSPDYRREVFDYAAAGRPDPFRSLLRSAELGVRIEDLSLRGVVYNPTQTALSVAVLEQAGTERRFRVRAGERVGPIRVIAVGPRSVQLLIEELGVARRETLELRKEPPTTGSGA